MGRVYVKFAGSDFSTGDEAQLFPLPLGESDGTNLPSCYHLAYALGHETVVGTEQQRLHNGLVAATLRAMGFKRMDEKDGFSFWAASRLPSFDRNDFGRSSFPDDADLVVEDGARIVPPKDGVALVFANTDGDHEQSDASSRSSTSGKNGFR